MGRPSIFSSQYEKQLKRKKRIKRATIFLAVCIAIVVIIRVYLGINFKGANFKEMAAKFQTSTTKKDTNTSKSHGVVIKSKTKTDTKKSVDKTTNIQLTNDKQVIVTYGDNKKIKSVNLNGLDGEYNISPSAQSVIIYQKSGQNIFYIDSKGTASDITYKTYSSTSGMSFSKDDVLKNNPNYVWCASPKFIDDNTIAYISQVPWFDNRPDKYIWRINLTDKSYGNTNLHGNDVKINDVSADKGIQIVTDGNTQYMKADGTVSN